MTALRTARTRLLAGALAASLAWTAGTWWRQQALPGEPASQATAGSARPSGSAAPGAAGDGGSTGWRSGDERAAPAEAVADPFHVTQWEPPVPPAQPSPPPPEMPAPEPAAPPLPFVYLGRQELAGGPASATEYFIARGGEVLAVRAGDRIGQDYRFEADDGQGALRFVYLPLQTRQTLFIGEAR